MSDAASGTTGLGNLAVKWLNAAEIPWTTDEAIRSTITARLRAEQGVVDGLRTEISAIRTFRSTLMTALVNREIEIPASYNRLPGIAAVGAT